MIICNRSISIYKNKNALGLEMNAKQFYDNGCGIYNKVGGEGGARSP